MLSTAAKAEGQITYVEKGDEMPYTGYAVDKPQMRHFRQINEEKKLLEQKVIKLEDLGVMKDEKIDYLEDQYTQVNKAYIKEQQKSTWQKYLYFAGGVILSGAAVYGASKLRK
jgi:hypothetical protein